MRKTRALARLLTLIPLLCFSWWAAHAQRQGELGMNCKGEVSRLPPEANLSCREWKIKLYKASTGKEWGLISAKTRDGAVRELESSRRWWRDDERGYQELWENVSEPICDMCDPSEPSEKSAPRWPALCDRLLSIGDIAAGRPNLCAGAKSFIDNWRKRVGKAAKQYADAMRGRQTGPFANVGDVLKDYGTAMRDVFIRVNDLQKRLDEATDFGEIEAGMNELTREGEAFDRAYNNLPGNVRAWLEGTYSAQLDGVWDSQDRGSMKIVQNGDDLKIYDAASGQLMWSATRDGDTYTIPPARLPYGVANARECGLSSNVLYTNISYRITVSDDGKSLTVEEISDKFVAGTCELGGVFTLGTWHRR